MTVSQLSSKIFGITGQILNGRDFGLMGKIVSLYNDQTINSALEILKSQQIIFKQTSPVISLRRILSIHENKTKVNEVFQALDMD